MPVKLTHTPSEFCDAFRNLKSARDVAALLEVEYSRLVYHLYKVAPAHRYTIFNIRKKSGGTREISAPISPLKILQRKLNTVLQEVSPTGPSVHGFVKDRNIRTNAQVHSGKKYVLNLDLQDFFPSINFGRVRGLFMATPYKFNSEVATVLAQICCFNGYLPQGAPTSPIISNLICFRMDRELRKLARKNNGEYTRYADDLTFSTNETRFPTALGEIKTSSKEFTLGKELLELIERNGFLVNLKKVRMRKATERQTVTGVVVNKSPNVSRKLVRQIRAMLHSFKKHGADNAEKEFHAKYYLTKHRNPSRAKPSFKKVLKGKIEFLGMIRGKLDPIYIKFLRQLKLLDANLVRKIPPANWIEEIRNALYVVEAEIHGELYQGTAFCLQGYGLVTCYHVLGDKLTVYHPSAPHKKIVVEVIGQDKDIDIAVLKPSSHSETQLLLGDDTRVREDDEIILAGYPNYAPGHTGTTKRGRIVGRHTISGIERFLIDASIVYGNSGGPVLNKDRRVIGIAVTGTISEGTSHTTDRHGVIPIGALKHIRISK